MVDVAEADVAVRMARDCRERRWSRGGEGEEMSWSRGRGGRGALRKIAKTFSLVELTITTSVVREKAAMKREMLKKLLRGARGRLEEIARLSMK